MLPDTRHSFPDECPEGRKRGLQTGRTSGGRLSGLLFLNGKMPVKPTGRGSTTSSKEGATGTPVPSGYRSTWGARRDPLYIVIPVTVIYAVIFLTGVVGNVSTCVVIARNKSMHTATNYYLFSLAVSDLLLLVSGLPPEMYYIWSHFPYVFGEVFCVIQGFAAETSANATVLTITAFTVERYVAICHPFLSHTMSKLTRAIKFVVAIWLVALCLAVPQAMSVGIVYETFDDGRIPYEDHYVCVVKRVVIPHAFEISTFVFFVAPMTLITVLYVLIGLQLRRSSVIARGGAAGSSVSLKARGMFKRKERPATEVVAVMLPETCQGQGNDASLNDDGRKNYSKNVQNKATRHVVKMLVAVVVAFFICWAPFHAQRLLAVYGTNHAPHMVAVFNVLTYVSGVLYYLSTTINPLLYHIMSNKFREAFKDTLARCCGRGRLARRRTGGGVGGATGGVGRCYSILSGRFSQNNSTSNGSGNGGGCCVLEDDGGLSGPRFPQDCTEVTSLREFRRPLVVSFRRRHAASAAKPEAPKLENELREALADLADDAGKSARSRRSHLETTTRISTASSSAIGNNGMHLRLISRGSTAVEKDDEVLEACRKTVVLLESYRTPEETGNNEGDDDEDDVDADGKVSACDRDEERCPTTITSGTLVGRGVGCADNFAKVEDIEIFHEHRFVMRDLKRNNSARVSEPSGFCHGQTVCQTSFGSERFLGLSTAGLEG
ncbi:cholecystokinin receptor type A-like isoform X1 [Neodiprion lecontei]|uniref:Cholecystokinin receptor type A-like isoform X1 n=1 Tax=Neodiprion lecontei TaxID=441921 RepID=A0A6J0BXW5_NEOLC|nr:cholecystokinin receptor type A-like isoform X1 [Neodiprion lecontei]XP_046598972.1 cholecystokinin receptor type A-like isoform X1 [Neodiprion lecontei]